jgi:hypothetical protein
VPPFSSQEEAPELDPAEQPTEELPALTELQLQPPKVEPDEHKEAA